MHGESPAAARGLASVRPVERPCPVTTSAEPRMWVGVIGEYPVPVDVASTPRMRRFTDIWVSEYRRQLASTGAE